jgi:hypothetical protein
MTEPPPANPRPIRAGRVWAGIGLALAEFLVLAACVIVGIRQLVRGDRGLGVGLLVGWAAGAVIFAGACVALILVVANSLNG